MPTIPKQYASFHKTTLKKSMTAVDQTTGITLNPLKDPTDATTNETWQITGAQVLRFSRTVRGKTISELIYAATASVDSTTKVITLGTCTRNITWKDGATITTLGNGIKWSAGTTVELVWTGQHAENTAFLDQANSFTGAQTFTSAILTPYATTGARDTAIPSPSEGQKCVVTGVGEQVYFGGTWVTVNAAASSMASETAQGTVELSTPTENAAATATGSTGAALVVRTEDCVQVSGDAGVAAGAVPVLNSSSKVDVTLLGTGTPSSSTYLRGDGAWTATGSLPAIFGDASDGTPDWSAGASLDPTSDFSYAAVTLPAGQTLTVSSVNTPLVIKTTGSVTINGTVNLDGKGGAGGDGGAGGGAGAAGSNGSAGTAGKSIIATFTTGAGGGGGGGTTDPTAGSGGGGGASAVAAGIIGVTGGGASVPGTAGAIMSANQLAFISNLLRGVACGAGGGGGGGGGRGGASVDGEAGGAGGAGGGALVWFIGGNLTLGADSVITADGANGTNGSSSTGGSDGGSGGGGGGGTILIIVAGSITDGGVDLSANNGAKATVGGDGGDGGDGKAIIYSLSTGTLIEG